MVLGTTMAVGSALVSSSVLASGPEPATSVGETAGPATPPEPPAFSLPTGSSIYDDLEHFRVLGFWRGSLELRPLSGTELRAAVRQIESEAARRSLGPGDDLRLRRLQHAGELGHKERRRESLASASAETPGRMPSARWDFGGAVQLYGVTTGLDSLADLERRPRRNGFLFLSVRGAVGPHLQIEDRFYEDYSRLTPRPRGHWVDNFPVNPRGTLTDPSARNDLAVLSGDWSWFDVRLGREDRHWGVGRRGTLFLSENPFPMDGVTLHIRTRYLSGSSIFAQTLRTPTGPLGGGLGGDGDTTGFAAFSARTGLGDAYMAAHRFEVHPPGPVRVGLYEAVLFGGRGLDLAYLNPVGFFVAMTQDIYDRAGADDKKILGGDALISLPPISLYGEFLLNRLVALDQAVEGNRSLISSYAELVGLRWSNPLRVSGTDFDLEYAHLDPEVYFHKDRDPRRAFLTQGELIGHWVGPNADDLRAAWSAPPLERWGTLRVEFEQVRWGILQGLRGVDLGYAGLTKSEKRWISGAVQQERIASLRWSRPGWGIHPLGLLDTDLNLARVKRDGVWPARSGRDAWQFEGRLRWRIEVYRNESGD
jgi:hypothetical protein